MIDGCDRDGNNNYSSRYRILKLMMMCVASSPSA